MDRATKEKALQLLGQKADGAGITYSEIALETGYSKCQLIRLSHSLEESGEAAALVHGNSGSRPHNAARPEEIAYLRKLKEPYPNVTIAHFRDIYIEDALESPEKADDVERCGLCMRGPHGSGSSSQRKAGSPLPPGGRGGMRMAGSIP